VADVVYGRRAVREALRGRREVRRLWCAAAVRDSLAWLPAGVAEASLKQLTARAGSPDHQGVVAEVSDFVYAQADELLAAERPLLVALDEVTDPHNLGAVARVAECAGAGGLLITARRSARVTPAVCRVSAGAVEHLPVARVENLADLLIAARRPGVWSYAAAADGAVAHDAADYTDGAVFVLGAEGRGVRRRVRAACDRAVAIPMRGRVESLNVSTAAAVLLFEAVRQRGGG
jgi:23S rRNA (guanosine2251-2'-O)-methyltransferase